MEVALRAPIDLSQSRTQKEFKAAVNLLLLLLLRPHPACDRHRCIYLLRWKCKFVWLMLRPNDGRMDG